MLIKNGPGIGDYPRGIRNECDNYNLSFVRQNVNSFLLHSERTSLAAMLAHGRVFCLRRPFLYPKHRMIFVYLTDFLGYSSAKDVFEKHNQYQILPDHIHQHDAKHFIDYLEENSALEKCGGVPYVRSIFSGIGGDNE